MTERVWIHPPRSSPLYYEGQPVVIANDECGGITRVCSHSIHDPQWWFARTVMDRQLSFALVDVGLNAGFFSRQTMIEYGERVQRIYGYEPDGDNLSDARTNLQPWGSRSCLREVALWHHKGEIRLFKDRTNCGNYSILPEAMEKRTCDVDVVPTRAMARECETWAFPFFYKSDAQGLDADLATLISVDLWRERACGAILELWRLETAPMPDDFRKILDIFPRKRLLNQQRDVTTDEIYEWLDESKDGSWDDLGLGW